MAYYPVAAVSDRRINADNGSIEYAVQWEGYGDEVTWERRDDLTERCADMVQAVDQRCMDATDAVLAQWRHAERGERDSEQAGPSPSPPPLKTGGCKRSRSSSRADSRTGDGTAAAKPEGTERKAEVEAEVLHGLLLRVPQRTGVKNEVGGEEDAQTSTEEATVLLLGEVVLAEEASMALNKRGDHRKKPHPNAARAAWSLSTVPALEVEKRWREAHGYSLLHSVDVSRHVTPFRNHFQLHLQSAEAQLVLAQEAARSSHLRILSIAPPRTTYSGTVFSAPVTLEGLVGEKDVEEMRLSVQLESPLYGNAAQEIVKPHVEQMVVRYKTTESSTGSSSVAGGAPCSNEPCSASCCVASMPLSVFRLAFPQLLIDYLLENSVVLH
ncbi:hypothetical protein ABB37_07084 [Leptomonas pyrrhocoris]|uniref:Chromo domain-containing protein n=1 Tax=Leptomonas pyrrhocoris TaxID=157538 RepID=A0A0M9FVW2_LEPPY|nr:hypothetical protein ABB37_07084 [Leptomonas pyrrhocoris]XP_015655599.1 hypothetical protein ABB37_07084 [Leptomonas pyrrhocoris]KPA77159.1 hypothetical protein ABB37_07084 [Leptomonas pyrrhocoris]KPA77160.1 hypothetical protein ABB37_07084 [Leptomonas pyrrhocoris]|eukprot:XP_015655598.1 hypothetical protein ABB37_07084 [Leptomonas pyrrhocoris]